MPSLTLIVLLTFLGSMLAALLPSNARNLEAWLVGAVTFSCAALLAVQHPNLQHGEVLREVIPWLPQYT